MICILYAVISIPRQRLLGIVELFLLNRFRGETGRSEEDRGEYSVKKRGGVWWPGGMRFPLLHLPVCSKLIHVYCIVYRCIKGDILDPTPIGSAL